MKIIVVTLALLMTVPAWANQMGLGVSLGNITGLNGKYWLDGSQAIDGGVGMSIGKNTNFSMHSDYLFHSEGAFVLNDVHPLDLYYGLGARMEFADDIELGLRIPVGLAHRMEDKSADTFVEIAPVLDFITNRGLEIHLMAGARYYF